MTDLETMKQMLSLSDISFKFQLAGKRDNNVQLVSILIGDTGAEYVKILFYQATGKLLSIRACKYSNY